ncbi:EthD family reductase [Alicyclobacillus cycloheptanicus]|jgi:uncharacterized protein (TIGR02118 family)|nr:EthD family reductase [Alicyclobacillus cycloheptanicus]
MVALYKRPDDIDAFLQHYEQVHMPLARKMPGLRRVEINRFFDARGGDADPFLMAELYFDSREAMFASIQSPEGKASGRDLQQFAGGIVRIYFADVETEVF